MHVLDRVSDLNFIFSSFENCPQLLYKSYQNNKQKCTFTNPATVNNIFHKALQYITTCMLCFSIVVHTQYRIQHRSTGHRHNIQHSFQSVFQLCAWHSSSLSYKLCHTHTVLSYTLARARLTFLKTPAVLMNAMIYKTMCDKVEAFHNH